MASTNFKKRSLSNSPTTALLASRTQRKTPVAHLPHSNTKTHCEQRSAIISNTVPIIHHYNDQTPSHHTGTVPLPPARRLSNLNHLHRLKPAEQPERHGAFCLEILSRSYGTLLGAALATSLGAISRDQVWDRLSTSIGVGGK